MVEAHKSLIMDSAKAPLIGVLRAPTSEHFLPASAQLEDAGFAAAEYTLTTPGAFAAIEQARRQFDEGFLIGAGTVNSVADARQAISAGAQFLVSQVTHFELIEFAQAQGIPYIPGVLTPNEIHQARAAGAKTVKVSPIGPLGGPESLAELRGPMPQVSFFPTGGVKVSEVSRYRNLGADYIGLSRNLFLDCLLTGDFTALKELSSRAVSQTR